MPASAGVRGAGDTADFELGWSELIGEGIAAATALVLIVLVLVFVAFSLLADLHGTAASRL